MRELANLFEPGARAQAVDVEVSDHGSEPMFELRYGLSTRRVLEEADICLLQEIVTGDRIQLAGTRKQSRLEVC